MKSIFNLLFLGFLSLALLPNLYAWQTETGSGVVSAQANVVLTSIEATSVLKSDTLSQLQGSTQLGGAVNYASFSSAGVLSFRNEVSSRDTILLNNDQYLAWLTTTGSVVQGGVHQRRIGMSADNVFVISADTNVIGRLSVSDLTTLTTASITTLNVISGGTFRNSSDTVLSNASATNLFVSSGLSASADVNFIRVSDTTLTILSGGILRSSSDTALSNVSLNNVAVPSTGLIRTSGDTVLTNVSASNVRISGTLDVSGNTTTSGGLNVRKVTVAALPAVSSNVSAVYMVSDATSASDCTAGGGTFGNICFSSGVGVWVDA